MIAMVESHPACALLTPGLEPGRKDPFILHKALVAKCPPVLVEALVQVFPNQVQQEYMNGHLPLHIALRSILGNRCERLLAFTHPAAMYVADPVTGYLPMEQALLNLGKNGSLGNVDAVDALLWAYPAFSGRVRWHMQA